MSNYEQNKLKLKYDYIHFKACRGGLKEILYGSDQSSPESPQQVGENTCRLLAEPNMKNFIIFYASVECK
jgi:hypothetical protein